VVSDGVRAADGHFPPALARKRFEGHGRECKEGDLPYMKGPPSRVLIGGVCRSCGSGSPFTQRHIKKGARRGTEANIHRVHSATTNPSLRTDHKRAEAGGKLSVAAATVLPHRHRHHLNLHPWHPRRSPLKVISS
jgi:hypothetical protein